MQLTIEKLVYGGEGLARLAADERGPGKAVFVPFVLAGERVEVRILKQKSGFARARAEKILQPSAERIPPACRYFESCGGCHYQHTSYDHQLAIKSGILRETLLRTAKLDWPGEIQLHPSPPWGYRNRTRMHLRAEPFALGYHRFASNTLLAVEDCPISSPLINRAIATVWCLGREGKVAAEISEMEFFVNAEDTALLIEVTLDATSSPLQPGSAVAKSAEALRAALLEVAGIALFSPAPGEVLVSRDIPKELEAVFGGCALTYDTRAARYRVNAGSFFQTNRFLVNRLVELVTAGRDGERALDLYAGVGLFSLMLSQGFREVTAVESAPFAFRDLRHNCPSNVTIHAWVEEFLASLPAREKYDLIVVDPPRAGLGEKAARMVAALGAPRLTYVSCDPATLSRDLRVLLESGYRVVEIHLVDLFPQTFHIESVFHLAPQS